MVGVFRKRVLEKLGGFDEDLGYGEDTDFAKRSSKQDFTTEEVGELVYHTYVDSLQDVFRQGRWYGKGMLRLIQKHPEEVYQLISVVLFTSLPLMIFLGQFYDYFKIIAILESLIVASYIIFGFLSTRNPYIMLVPLIKVVRSYGQIIGIIEGFFTDDLGRE